MNVFIHLLGFVSLILVSGCVTHRERIICTEEYEMGSHQAKSDLSNNRYRLLDNLGIIRHRTLETRAELKKRHGIEYELDRTKSFSYVKGYNDVMRASFKEQFGEDYYEKVMLSVTPEAQSQFGIPPQQ